MSLSLEETNKLGRVLMGKLTDLSIQNKCRVAAKAGMDVSKVPSIQSNPPVDNALFKAFEGLSAQEKQIALPIIADGIIKYRSDHEAELVRLLTQHGYDYVNGTFIRSGLADDREKAFVPPSSAEQLSTAFDRLARGDESGAITAACGAVDTITNIIYEREGWGTPPDSFQAKVNTVLNNLKIYDEMLQDLKEAGVRLNDAQEIVQELHEATKRSASALQVIRRSLSDVHGKRPTYTRLTYDSIKWASAICGLLEGKV
jgi:hypothetical protein